MSLVRCLGFTTLACGCVIGKYRDVSTGCDLAYVEEKGAVCGCRTHKRNQTIAMDRDQERKPILAPVRTGGRLI